MNKEDEQWEFCDAIDCRFPYNDEAAERLIREACALGGHAAFTIAFELARVPRGTRVSRRRLEQLLELWERGFDHPLKLEVANLCRHQFNKTLPTREEVDTVVQLLKQQHEPVALAVLQSACLLSNELDADVLGAEVERAWAASKMSMAPLRHCGFCVVRKAGMNFETDPTGVLPKTPPCVDGTFYCGVERCQWTDFDDARRAGGLSAAAEQVWQELRRANDDFTGVRLTPDFRTARAILALPGCHAERNEIIAVGSGALARSKAELPPDEQVPGELVGYDIQDGWSLVREGVFAHPNLFPRALAECRGRGLLATPQSAMALRNEYQAQETLGLVEPVIHSEATPVLVLEVRRVE